MICSFGVTVLLFILWFFICHRILMDLSVFVIIHLSFAVCCQGQRTNLIRLHVLVGMIWIIRWWCSFLSKLCCLQILYRGSLSLIHDFLVKSLSCFLTLGSMTLSHSIQLASYVLNSAEKHPTTIYLLWICWRSYSHRWCDPARGIKFLWHNVSIPVPLSRIAPLDYS